MHKYIRTLTQIAISKAIWSSWKIFIVVTFESKYTLTYTHVHIHNSIEQIGVVLKRCDIEIRVVCAFHQVNKKKTTRKIYTRTVLFDLNHTFFFLSNIDFGFCAKSVCVNAHYN